MEKKPCPVDRGKLLIGLECCRTGDAEVCMECPYFSESCDTAVMSEVCMECPYFSESCDTAVMSDALAYIYYLEEQLNAKADGSD